MRVFVAVWPDDSTQEQLDRLQLGSLPGLRLVESQQWHVTLRFLGDVSEDRVPVLIGALEQSARELVGPVRCTVGPATAWFPGQRVLQIPVSGLDQVAEAIRSATIPIAPDSNGEPAFTGHLTVARASGSRIDRSARPALAGVPFSATFDVESFDLVASQASAEGQRYTTLARVLF